LIPLVDTHAHLQEDEFSPDRDAVIERARAAGVGTIVVPAVDLETAESAIALTEHHDGIYATAGYHPHEAQHLTASALDGIEALLARPKVVAVGEIGLDFYRLHSPREAQIEAFEAQLALAERHAMPVVIHCRDAWQAMAPALQPWARRVRATAGERPIGVLHYFSSTLEEARRYYELGFLISIHTSVTHPRSGALREVAAALPLNALVIETDSPYGAPQSQRGRRNEPAYVVEALKQLAEVRNSSVEEIAAATAANARRLFGLGVDVQNKTASGARG
jgi:TatD DNase family protein